MILSGHQPEEEKWGTIVLTWLIQMATCWCAHEIWQEWAWDWRRPTRTGHTILRFCALSFTQAYSRIASQARQCCSWVQAFLHRVDHWIQVRAWPSQPEVRLKNIDAAHHINEKSFIQSGAIQHQNKIEFYLNRSQNKQSSLVQNSPAIVPAATRAGEINSLWLASFFEADGFASLLCRLKKPLQVSSTWLELCSSMSHDLLKSSTISSALASPVSNSFASAIVIEVCAFGS